jgi:N-acetyl-1-D-myo-inositol-2-amino-2-deoxy-alpha-D-glucopyranoside deacetylase
MPVILARAADVRSPAMTTRRLLLVHAHPDDETVGTGATMARYAAEGAEVTLVTCTLGEEGEVRVPLYAELAADRGDQLGGYRIAELRDACRELGVTDHRFLGGPGRYRDSGMMGLPQNENPRSFWQADLDEAAGRLVEILREVRPQVVLTYDPNGFYGHPDHIQAHRVAMRGVELAADPAAFGEHGDAWQVQKVYWTAVPKSFLAAGIERFADSAENPFGGVTDVADLPFGTPDEDIAAEIDGSAHTGAKLAAMRAHATQIAADDWLFTLADLGGDGALGREHYTLAVGEKAVADGWEDDLFAGTR